MNNRDFSSSLQSAGFIREEFNSNTSWGFGGAVGLRFTRGDTVVKSARACCRNHTLNTDFVTVTVRDRQIYDEVRQGTTLARALEIALAN
jgi:hypothetical protein